MRLYYETARSTSAAWGRVAVPTGMAMSGADMFATPREWAERSYDVVSWTELPRGGHFLEWEVPELIATDLRAFFATDGESGKTSMVSRANRTVSRANEHGVCRISARASAPAGAEQPAGDLPAQLGAHRPQEAPHHR